jgi:type II secretory pathway pseudopilin PulG
LPIKAGVVVALAILVIAVTVWATDVISKRRYEAKIQGLEATAREALEKAGAEMERAKAARTRAETLEAELSKASQRLLDANADLVDARNLSGQTRKIYVEKKMPVSVPVYLTGDATADSRALCAKLAADGFPCR